MWSTSNSLRDRTVESLLGERGWPGHQLTESSEAASRATIDPLPGSLSFSTEHELGSISQHSTQPHRRIRIHESLQLPNNALIVTEIAAVIPNDQGSGPQMSATTMHAATAHTIVPSNQRPQSIRMSSLRPTGSRKTRPKPGLSICSGGGGFEPPTYHYWSPEGRHDGVEIRDRTGLESKTTQIRRSGVSILLRPLNQETPGDA